MRLTLALLLACAAVSPAATLIEFNDGTGDGAAVGSFYSGLGVTFSNGEWASFDIGYVPHPDSTGLRIVGDGANFLPKVGTPISFTFSGPQNVVSVIANSVNANGARMDLYDAEVGGSLISFDEVVGASGALNSNFVLTASGSGIRRVELYQPFSVETEGVLFDNLEFSAIPEPSQGVLIGVAALAAVLRRRRS